MQERTPQRIVHLSSTGAFLGIWGQQGSNPGQLDSPGGMAIDKQGNIYVADDSNNRIQKFSSNRTLLAVWGTPVKDVVHFNLGPDPLAINAEGIIYTIDADPSDNIWHIIKVAPSGQLIRS